MLLSQTMCDLKSGKPERYRLAACLLGDLIFDRYWRHCKFFQSCVYTGVLVAWIVFCMDGGWWNSILKCCVCFLLLYVCKRAAWSVIARVDVYVEQVRQTMIMKLEPEPEAEVECQRTSEIRQCLERLTQMLNGAKDGEVSESTWKWIESSMQKLDDIQN